MKIEMMDIGHIRPYAKNPRKNDRAVEVVANSLEQYGFQQPIVIDQDHTIIVGHTRYRAAKKLGLVQVPVLVAQDLTQEQAQAYRIMDNRSNENAQWDMDLLTEELQTMLNTIDIPEASHQTGFTESELNRLFRDENELLESVQGRLTPQTYSQTGDVWHLGNHRIINGDSTDPATVARLLDQDQINMVWEDAPYGITYQTPNGVNHTAEYNQANNHIIANDTLSPEQLDSFLHAHMTAVEPHMMKGCPIYWCHDIRFNHQFKSVLEAHQIHIADTLIWRKNNASTWMTDYAKYYEPILYGWKTGAEHPWYGKNMQPNAYSLDDLNKMTREQLIKILQNIDTNYQEFKKEPRKVASLHPTVKPVRLIEYHIYQSTRPNDRVFDGFSGSGSTLMAAEISGRQARCIELEPKFVDVTIRRWQELTQLQAKRSDGVLWDDLVASEPVVSADLQKEVNINLNQLFGLTE